MQASNPNLADAPHPAQVAKILFEVNTGSLALMLKDSSCLLYHTLAFKGFSPKYHKRNGNGNSLVYPSPVEVSGPLSDACFLQLRNPVGKPRFSVAFLAAMPESNGGSGSAVGAWLRLGSRRFIRVSIELKERRCKTTGESRKGSVGNADACDILGFLDVPYGFGIRMEGSVNVVVVYAPAVRKFLVLAGKVKEVGGQSANKALGNWNLSLMECCVLDCDWPVYGIGLSAHHLILGVENGVRVWLLRPLVKGKGQKSKRNGQRFIEDEIGTSNNRIVPSERNKNEKSRRANGDSCEVVSEVHCIRQPSVSEGTLNGCKVSSAKVASEAFKVFENGDAKYKKCDNLKNMDCLENGITTNSNRDSLKNIHSGGNDSSKLLSDQTAQRFQEEGDAESNLLNGIAKKLYQLKNGQVYHVMSTMDDDRGKPLPQLSSVSPMTSCSSSLSGYELQPFVPLSTSSSFSPNALETASGNGHHSEERTITSVTSLVPPRNNRLSSGMNDAQKAISIFIPFKDSNAGGVSLAKPSCKPLRALSIHSLNSTQFIILDSMGDLHILRLSDPAVAGELHKEHRFIADVDNSLIHLKCSMKVRMVSVSPQTSAVHPRILVSDGRHTIHVLQFLVSDSSAVQDTLTVEDTENMSDEKVAKLSVVHAMMLAEHVRAMSLLSENAMLVLTEGSTSGYCLSGS